MYEMGGDHTNLAGEPFDALRTVPDSMKAQ